MEDGIKNLKKIKNKKSDLDISDNIIEEKDDEIIFDGFIFKKYARDNYYNTLNKNNIITYKCINYRYDERNRRKLNLDSFCNAKIVCNISKHRNRYILKNNHSEVI